MSMMPNDYLREVSSAVGVASAADIFTWTPGGPVEIHRVALIAATSAGVDLATATSSFTIRVDQQVKASANDAGYTRTSGALGTINFTTSAQLGVAGAGIYTETSSPVVLKAGEQAIFAVTSAASAASTVHCVVEYRSLPWTGHGRPTSEPGDGTPSGNIITMTKV